MKKFPELFYKPLEVKAKKVSRSQTILRKQYSLQNIKLYPRNLSFDPPPLFFNQQNLLNLIPKDTLQRQHLFVIPNSLTQYQLNYNLKYKSAIDNSEICQENKKNNFDTYPGEESSNLKKQLILLKSQEIIEKQLVFRKNIEENTNFESHKEDIDFTNDMCECVEIEKGLKEKYRIPFSNHFSVIKSFQENKIKERQIPEFPCKSKKKLEKFHPTLIYEVSFCLINNEKESPLTIKNCSKNRDKHQDTFFIKPIKYENQQIFNLQPDQKEKITPKFCPFKISEERKQYIKGIQRNPSINLDDNLDKNPQTISLDQIAKIRKNLRKIV